MAQYCVNKNPQSTGEHEVHNVTAGCAYLPDPSNRLALGDHQNCHTAVLKAKQTYSKVDGCYYCSKACHTR
jgi:hypothetical protein